MWMLIKGNRNLTSDQLNLVSIHNNKSIFDILKDQFTL